MQKITRSQLTTCEELTHAQFEMSYPQLMPPESRNKIAKIKCYGTKMKLLPSNYRSTFYRIYSENKEKYEDKKNDGDWTKIK